MNETKTTTAEHAIQEKLKRLEWMIPDAQRRLAELAREMLRRAENAVKECDAMIANQACSMMWVEFSESDIRNAREAKAELNKLYEQQSLLKFFLNKDPSET